MICVRENMQLLMRMTVQHHDQVSLQKFGPLDFGKKVLMTIALGLTVSKEVRSETAPAPLVY